MQWRCRSFLARKEDEMPNAVRRIVAGIAELSAGDPTLLVAMEVARAAGAELHLVHAYQLPPLMTMSPGIEVAFPEGDARYGEMLQASLEAAARALPGGEMARCRVVPGSPGPALAAVAAEIGAGLVIVGAARRSRLGRAILGTTAQRVLRGASVPVLVARRPMLRPPKRVLLTTDLSELSSAVHETAVDTIDAFFGAPERVRSLLVLGWLGVPAPLTPGAMERVARTELETFLEQRDSVVPIVEPVVRSGITADEIVAEAREWDADLLVVGTHARGWGARLMLGSVAESALREAPCNVLAVPPVPTPAAVVLPAAAWEESPELATWLAAGI
jgi:nucleotide-binding universal stress UspA family protein